MSESVGVDEDKEKSVLKTCQSVGSILNTWKFHDMIENMLDDNNKIMNMKDNWAFGLSLLKCKRRNYRFFHKS